jgi:hypothetical protein
MTNQIFGARIILPGLNFGATGLTSTVDYLAQLKSYGTLLAAYLFLDATNGSGYTSAIDLSGNGKTATARTTGGYQTPQGSTSGILVPAGGTVATSGAVFDTGIPIDNTNGFTRIWAGQQLAASATVSTSPYYAMSGSTNGFPATPGTFLTGTGASQRGPVQTLELTTATGQWENYGVDDLSTVYTGNGTMAHYQVGLNLQDKFHIHSLRMNIPALTFSYDLENSVSVAHNAALASAAGTQSFVDNHAFGFANYGSNTNSLPATAQISAFVLYAGALSDTNNANAISTIQKIMQLRQIAI